MGYIVLNESVPFQLKWHLMPLISYNVIVMCGLHIPELNIIRLHVCKGVAKKWAFHKPLSSPLNLQQSSADEWRQKLDSQKGAVLATELKNNSFKLAKWTVCSLLAGSDQIKFGWVLLASARRGFSDKKGIKTVLVILVISLLTHYIWFCRQMHSQFCYHELFL